MEHVNYPAEGGEAALVLGAELVNAALYGGAGECYGGLVNAIGG